ncbi:MAG: hypothetical protein LBH16_06845 [Treponema sp.]|jgi:hypothetical protein|nr:hypothetical protein [Treponema sp.]
MKINKAVKIIFGIMFQLLILGCMSQKDITPAEQNYGIKLGIQYASYSNNDVTNFFSYALLTSDLDHILLTDSDNYVNFDQDQIMKTRIQGNLRLFINEKNQSSYYNFINLKELPFTYNGNTVYSYIYSHSIIPDSYFVGVALISIDTNVKKMYFWRTHSTSLTRLPGISDFGNIFIGNWYRNIDIQSMERAYSVFSTYNKYQESISSINDLDDSSLFITFTW